MQIHYRGGFNGNGVTTYQYGSGGSQVMMMVPSFIKPPPSTEDRFVFPAEIFALMPSFRMFPEYITASLPKELEGKIRESEWADWMSILIQDRKSHACGDSFGCGFTAMMTGILACYPCIRSHSRSKSMKKFVEKINAELFAPRGMFIKLQEGYMMGAPVVHGMAACSWYTISLNSKESEKLKKEPKRVPLVS